MQTILRPRSSTIHNVECDILYESSIRRVIVGSSDPLVDVLGLLRPRTVVAAPIHAATPWAVRFDPFPHVKLGLVINGECWLQLDGAHPLLLHEGDFYLLGSPPPYTLGSSLDAVPCPVAALPPNANGTGVRIGADADEDAYVCSIDFLFDDADASMLFDVLPPVVLVRAGDPRGPLLKHLSTLMVFEIESTGVGQSLVLEHLAQITLVHMLRARADGTDRPTGWLAALADDGVGAALRAMHGDVGRRWTLCELAQTSRMSRSAFAAAFKAKVGIAPLTYLIQWRMSLARAALRGDAWSISDLAAATGYESESAFSTAFRRVVGSSPRAFRRAARRPGRTTAAPRRGRDGPPQPVAALQDSQLPPSS
jgi:AraC-like DNA-binding protein